MADYKHGAYGTIQSVSSRVASESRNAIVYIGTAPVQNVEGGAENVNKPIAVNNIADARKKFGYSDDFAKYTLCEAMHVHFEQNGVGPLVLINVLDPVAHKASESGSKSIKPENGRIVLADAESIIIDSIAVAGKTKGTDYSVAYSYDKKTVTIVELTAGALGTSAISVTYDSVDATKVTASDVIGSTDGFGLNKGVYAVANVYQETGYIPSFILAPGFASDPAVHKVMAECSKKINGHWDAYMFVDMPIVNGESAMTLESAVAWKNDNGYTLENETVFYPMVKGIDGKKYHLSVLAAANFQSLLVKQDGIPYRTASNTACDIIENLYLGEDVKGRVYDDTMINNKLCKNGISSAAFVGGHWSIWGAHSADYSQTDKDSINVSETNRMMLYYISNDFQHRRTDYVDKALTANDIQTIVAEEQTRLDALVKIGALTYGEVHLNAENDNLSDIMNGDFSFTFNVTTMPLAMSLTAVVNWTAEGFVTYYGTFAN